LQIGLSQHLFRDTCGNRWTSHRT